MLDGFLDRFLEGNEQIVRVEEAASQISLDLERILPVHLLDPTLYVEEVAGREELLRVGIHSGNTDGTRFTAYDVAYLLKLEEIVMLSRDNAEMVGVWCDAGMSIVDCGYTIARLVPPFALDSLWGPVIITFLFEAGWSMQVEYDNCMCLFQPCNT
jgi:hypothetical protein